MNAGRRLVDALRVANRSVRYRPFETVFPLPAAPERAPCPLEQPESVPAFQDEFPSAIERRTAVRSREGAVAAREDTATLREEAAGLREVAAGVPEETSTLGESPLYSRSTRPARANATT